VGYRPHVLDAEPMADTWANRLRAGIATTGGEVVRWAWHHTRAWGAIGPRSRIAREFGSFGQGTAITFPYETLVNPSAIHLGRDIIIAPYVSLSAGWEPGWVDLPERVLTIGDRCLIGRGSSIIAHEWIEIGNDVWTGHHVHITDMNHGYEDVEQPISRQNQPEAPVVIGDGSWLGHGVVVLPGVTIGRHVVVGAGSVVVHSLPDFSVAVGAPARVVRRHDPAKGWVPVSSTGNAPPSSKLRS
jgi:acetyltransferase-like isoleucine patch superfamily enzyme